MGSLNDKAYEASLRFLAHRPRSRAEVRQRLKRRALPEAVVQTTLERLQDEGYLDDGAFARYWRENRQQFSPRSRRLLTQELRQKGVDGETIAAALEGLDDEAEALSAATKKARGLRRYPYEVLQQKLVNFLRQRGFPLAIAQAAAQKALHEGEEQR